MGKGSKYAVFSYEIVEYVCMIFFHTPAYASFLFSKTTFSTWGV